MELVILGNTMEKIIAYIVAGEIRVKAIKKNNNKAADKFVHVGNGTDSLAASLYVPSNDKLVDIHGNSIIQSVFASEKAMASHGSADAKNSEAGLAVPGDLAPDNPGIHPFLYRSPAAGQIEIRKLDIRFVPLLSKKLRN
ncbi:hypothetical protein KY290_021644 [Solanum tuberosum]|uniref:Uncharacterized protein n=1 Tax=Solanum tuberosum TaxID=4113 RepID=A0ABQ7V467_SOLTU|nr:hypothetical protein KY289_020817 [Solanum tuberosum]KAH0758151.1 hypothetical protein KY290_021644 [Solanum tuberosum]